MRVLRFIGRCCIIFVLNHTRIDKNRNFCSKPRCKAQTKSMCYAKPRTIFCPQRLEMHCQTYLPSSIHLLRLSIELWQLKLRCRSRISNGNIELQIELVFQQIVNIPTFASPSCPLRISGGDPKPVVVVGLVHGGIGDQRFVFFLQALRPRATIARPRFHRQQRDLG